MALMDLLVRPFVGEPVHVYPGSEICTDTHSRLNDTRIRGRLQPTSVDDVVRFIGSVRERGESMSVAGACHAMGGQQFAKDAWLLDIRAMNRVLEFDRETGLIHVQAGITWPELMRHYLSAQRGEPRAWGIRQKQTGADRLTIGGAVSANIHGRGLAYAPFIEDIEALEVALADGSVVHCSRRENRELFRLVVGGYGLFGVVTSAKIRLVARRKVQRVVELMSIEDLVAGFKSRIDEGYLYGDFQFSTAPEHRGFLSDGVFCCYRPVDASTPIPSNQIRLSLSDWRRLLYLAHRSKQRAFKEFADFYLRSSGQIYWSDTHQLSVYLDHYHDWLDQVLQPHAPGSEMITELYVPRERLASFMDDVRRDFRENAVNLIYGTVRLIERDRETMLVWARESYACVIFNLHVDHDARGISESAAAFRRLIDIAIHHGGSYFLTYHRHATRSQVRTCYPQFTQFLCAKQLVDPDGVFQSDWYRHYRSRFAESV